MGFFVVESEPDFKGMNYESTISQRIVGLIAYVL